MKLDQAIREAVASNEPQRLEGVIDGMRFKLGYNYAQCLNAALKSVPGLTEDRWEEMMMAIDNNAVTLHN